MASTIFLSLSSIFLLSLLVIASAGDYYDVPKPENIYGTSEKIPKPDNSYSSTPASEKIPQVDNSYSSSTPTSENIPKSHKSYSSTPKSENVKPDHEYGPKPDSVPEYNPKPDSSKPKSDSDNSYSSTPKSENVKPDHEYAPKPKPDSVPEYNPKADSPNPESDSDNSNSSTPTSENVKPDNEYAPKPESDSVPKNEYSPKSKPDIVKPENGYRPKPKSDNVDEYIPKPAFDLPKLTTPTDKPDYVHLPKPDIYVPKPDLSQPKLPFPKLENLLKIGIEGLILCKSGRNFVPLEGAVARIICSVLDQNGYERAPFSSLTSATDSKGYFFDALSLLGLDVNVKLTNCKVKLEKSPLETCNVPSDVNKGISGAHLSSYRILSDHKIKLYSVGPFFYTSEPANSTPFGY